MEVLEFLKLIARDKKRAPQGSVYQLRHGFLELGRAGICFLSLALSAQAFAVNAIYDEALAESAYISVAGKMNPALVKLNVAIQKLCERACAWPKLTEEINRSGTRLSQKSRGPMARIERLEPMPMSGVALLKGGAAEATADLVESMRFLHLTSKVTFAADELRQAFKTPAWKITFALQPELPSVEVLTRSLDRYQAWVQSDNPAGYLRRLAELDAATTQVFTDFVACFRADAEIAYALDFNQDVLVQKRLLFKEIDVARRSWGVPVAGLFMNQASTFAADRLVTFLNSISEKDLSEMGGELNECRALAWALQALGTVESTINSARLRCESARRDGLPLSLQLPDEAGSLQLLMWVHELRRQRGHRPFVRERRAASLFRDLQGISAANGSCPSELVTKVKPLIEELRRFISNGVMEDVYDKQ